MTRTPTLLLAAALVAALALLAAPASAHEGGDMGVCVVGADSPCNSEHNETNNTTDPNEPVQYAPGDLPYASGPADTPVKEPVPEGGDVGICVVGAGGPCNGDADAPEVSDGLPLAPEKCVPGPATMCAPDGDPATEPLPEPEPTRVDDIQCVRAPCELPKDAAGLPGDAEVEPAPIRPSPFAAVWSFVADVFGRLGF